jgi:hypothetical protein
MLTRCLYLTYLGGSFPRATFGDVKPFNNLRSPNSMLEAHETRE